MSNTERQRRFRERNPGYYGRLHAKRRAAMDALAAAKQAQQVVQREVLMLPAPGESSVLPLPVFFPQAQREPVEASVSR